MGGLLAQGIPATLSIISDDAGQFVRRQLPCPVGDNYLDRLIDM
jgi:hypothetical protein